MEIDLTSLNTNHQIKIDEEVSFPKEDIIKAGMLSLNQVKVAGEIIERASDYQLNLTIKGKMVLPCSLTLEPVDYPFSVDISENLSEIMENCKKNEKTIDILPIIWENILMEIPMRIISPNAKKMQTKGDGWELITDNNEKGNKSLSQLKDLL